MKVLGLWFWVFEFGCLQLRFQVKSNVAALKNQKPKTKDQRPIPRYEYRLKFRLLEIRNEKDFYYRAT